MKRVCQYEADNPDVQEKMWQQVQEFIENLKRGYPDRCPKPVAALLVVERVAQLVQHGVQLVERVHRQ